MKKDVGHRVALIMSRVVPLLACCMNLILSAPSGLEAQSSPTELSLLSLYERPVEWPKFDKLFQSSRATSWREFSKLNQLDGFRWLAESDTARAYRSFARAVMADGGVPSDNERIGPSRRKVYEQFRASVPRAIDLTAPRIAQKYFVDPIRLRVGIPSNSGGDAANVRLRICRNSRWLDAQGAQLDRSATLSSVTCGGDIVSRAMRSVRGSRNVYETTLGGQNFGRADLGLGRFAIVSVGDGIGHIESVWNLDVTLETPLGLTRPPLAGVTPRFRKEMVTVRGIKNHPVSAAGWGLVTALGVLGLATAGEAWKDGYDCSGTFLELDTLCQRGIAGTLLFLIGGTALAFSSTWDSEALDSEAVRYNDEMRRATAEANRLWADMQRRTMITVTPGARLPAVLGVSRDPSGG